MTMHTITLRAPWSVSLVAATLMLAACTHQVEQAADTQPLPVARTPSASPSRLAQIGYGAHADFRQCQLSACPTRTPKTLGAAPVPTPAQVTVEEVISVGPPVAMQDRPLVASPSVEAAEPVITEETQTWSLGFAFGSAQLGPAGLKTLSRIAAALPATGHITIAGRTDDSGPAAVNDALAKARADTVLGHLLHARPDLDSAITVEAAGKCCFANANDTAVGRARNRRVEITLRAKRLPP